VVGNALPAAAPSNAEIFVIVDVVGSTGPAGTPPYNIGDWFLSSGTAWQFLNVGFQSPAATTAVEGVVYLATNAEVLAGTNTSNKAVNPASLQAKMSDETTGGSSFVIASNLAVTSVYNLANAALPKTGGTMTGAITFVAGQTFPVAGIADATTSSKGVVQVGTNIDVTSGTISVPAATTSAQGVVQVGTNISVASGTISVATGSTSTAGVLQLTDSTSSTSTTTAATPNSVKSAYDLANAAIPNSVFNAKGDIIVGTGNDTYGNFPSGANGQILVVDSAETFGVKWSNAAAAGVLSVTGTAPIIVDNTDFQNPIIGVSAASSSAAGVVQLNDTVTSTSTTQAATANAVKFVYDLVAAALPKTGGTMTGNIIFSTGTTVNFADTASASVTAANQLATVVDNSNGNLTIVAAFDAGEF
jgi:hypothetical protein